MPQNVNLYAHIYDSLRMTAPLLVLTLAALAVLVADVLLPAAQRWLLSLISLLGVGLTFLALHATGGASGVQYAYFGALQTDYLVFLAHNVILGMAVFIILLSPRYLASRDIPPGEYYAILLFATLSMMVLAASSELLTLFLNFELVSISLYILTGMERRNLRSSEAAFKYFLVGSFAAAFLLLGIAFVFGGSGGHTTYTEIAAAIQSGQGVQPRFLLVGFGLLLVGFCFKLTLAPFHMYAPDVYEGSPTPATMAIATGSKVAGFVAFFHIVQLAAGAATTSGGAAIPLGLWAALYVVAVASMVIGNVAALIQPNIKRMLAYSSIAHSAYTIVPMVVILKRPDLIGDAQTAIAYYLMAYTVMTLLAFGVLATLGAKGESRIANYAGLGRRSPGMAMLMALAMISLTGIPPTVGFFGKWRLFSVAIEGDHVWLAVIGVLASVSSAFYYLRVIVTMYMVEPDAQAAGAEAAGAPAPDSVNYVALGLGAVAVFAFAIFPWIYLFAA